MDAAVSRATDRAWWNRDKLYKTLDLSTDQRREMDALLTSFIELTAELRPRQRSANESFASAAAEGKWQDARQAATLGIETSGAVGEAQIQLVLDVLTLLSDDQRSLVSEQFPHLLRPNWAMRTTSTAMAQISRGRQSRDAAPGHGEPDHD